MDIAKTGGSDFFTLSVTPHPAPTTHPLLHKDANWFLHSFPTHHVVVYPIFISRVRF
ncbi:MAG: hypothetical protein LBJ41_12030 [Treponema sp.]|nr:hypothetical protein [Treponema sp.]